MKICLVAPERDSPMTGTRVTTRRWLELLQKFGHRVNADPECDAADADLVVALAPRGEDAAGRLTKPYVVALNGDDLPPGAPGDDLLQTLEDASHIIALDPAVLDALEPAVLWKASLVHPSAKPILPVPAKATNCFQACVVEHIRAAEDASVVAAAVSKLPDDSLSQAAHAGAALTEALRELVRSLASENTRYRWLGPLPHEEARLLIARSHILVLPTRLHAAANTLAEALALGVPVLAGRRPGVESILGDRYPGFFDVSDVDALSELLHRAETDEIFYRRLQLGCEKAAQLTTPSAEMKSWQLVLDAIRS